MDAWIDFVSSAPFDRTWLIAAVALLAVGVLLLLAGLVALLRLHPFSFLLRIVFGAVVFALGVVAATVAVGTAGYQALTREQTAATVRVEPAGPQRFNATVRLADGRTQTFALAGDEIYIDAHILKWQPIVNMVGLHTAYELDRIAGRYHTLKDEQALPRTVHALGAPKPIDLFSLRRRYVMLAPLVDAEYGSASFVPVTRPAELEVRVSTTGLLIREKAN